MIRAAAAGDVHFDRNSRGRLSRYWPELEDRADIFLLAGDLTQIGHEEEACVLAQDLRECPVPVIAVLGNHDYHSDRQDEVKACLVEAGVTVLDRSGTSFRVGELSVGIYGLKGFGGGFLGACCSDFGEPETKAFVRHTKILAEDLRRGLEGLNTDYRIALLHYSPTPDTLLGERKEIFPFLGSYLLGEAVDQAHAHVVFHGHAHKGIEVGQTPGGVPVRNVAQPVIRHAFNMYYLHELTAQRPDVHQKSVTA
jgi:Icc-related predicted phosphoesterase